MRSRILEIALCCACLTVLSLSAEDAAPGATVKPGATPAPAAADPVWLTSFEKAKELAAKEHKKILTNFTGSDWCPWCKKLEAEIFATAAFKTWAAQNVILLKLDFPRHTPQDAATKTQNQSLLEKFSVEGFPTVLFLDETGKELGRSGYQEGGPAKWTTAADLILSGKAAPAAAQ